MASNVTAGVAATDATKTFSARFDGIDRVRALAALSVMLAHLFTIPISAALAGTKIGFVDVAEYAPYIFTGHPAVIAFFVVSGFCIHYPYAGKKLPIFPFLVARLIRIMFPVAVAFALAKLARVKGFNFVDGYILWSIVCELFYYAFYPVFLYLSRWLIWRRQFYISFAISLMLVVWLGTDQYGNAHNYGPWLNWIVALPSWLAGCVLAHEIHDKGKPYSQFPVVVPVLLWRAIVAVLASVLAYATLNTAVGYYLTMNAFAMLVVFWVRAEISAPECPAGWLHRIGGWSYSIYLVHIPVAALVAWLFRAYWTNTVQMTAVLLVLGFCWVFFRLIEYPSHRLARRAFLLINPRSWFICPLVATATPRSPVHSN